MITKLNLSGLNVVIQWLKRVAIFPLYWICHCIYLILYFNKIVLYFPSTELKYPKFRKRFNLYQLPDKSLSSGHFMKIYIS